MDLVSKTSCMQTFKSHSDYSYEIIFSSNISSGNDEILKENIILQRYSEPCFFHCLFSNLGPVSNVVLCKMTRLKHDLDFGFYRGLSL